MYLFITVVFICSLGQRSPTFSAPGTGFMEDNFSTDQGWVGEGSGSNASDGSGGNGGDGEQRGAADEASLARPLLTSCRAARFLTGHGPLPVCGPGLWTPALEYLSYIIPLAGQIDCKMKIATNNHGLSLYQGVSQTVFYFIYFLFF